jgi:hypothetical protein
MKTGERDQVRNTDLLSTAVYHHKKTTEGILILRTVETTLMPWELFCFHSERHLKIYCGLFCSKIDHKLGQNEFLRNPCQSMSQNERGDRK